jgi:hypothetical protein
MELEIKTSRRRRGNASNSGGTDDNRAGRRSISPSGSPDAPDSEQQHPYYPVERNYAAVRPPARPGTAVESRRAAPSKKVYGSIRPAQPSRTAWDANGGTHADIRQRRVQRVAMGNLDKEEMQDRLTALQRQACVPPLPSGARRRAHLPRPPTRARHKGGGPGCIATRWR